MLNNTLKRPALGHIATLGSLYDVRTESFLPLSLAPGDLADLIITRTHIDTCDTRFSSSESTSEKFRQLGIDTELGASLLAGMVRVAGAANYLNDSKQDQHSATETLYHTVSTVHEKLNFTHNEARQLLDFARLSSGSATHVVAEISYGVQTIITASCRLSDYGDRDAARQALKQAFQQYGNTLLPDYPDPFRYNEKQRTRTEFEVKTFTDLRLAESEAADFDRAHKLIIDTPARVASMGDGRGIPVAYTLLPTAFFAVFFGINIPEHVIYPISTDIQQRFVTMFDEIVKARQVLASYYTKLTLHRLCVPSKYIESVGDQIKAAQRNESDLKQEYAKLVKGIKAGKADAQEMWQLLDQFRHGQYTPAKIVAVAENYSKKMNFADNIVRQGGKYLGFPNTSLEMALLKTHHTDAYVFYFNDYAMIHGQSWNENLALLHHTLANSVRYASVFVVDCDVTGDKIDKAYMSSFRNGVLVTKDVLEEQKALAGKSVMRYSEHELDQTVMNAPAQRRVIRIPCPGSGCDQRVRCDWICFKCHVPVEFGMVDRYCYCDCGRSHYKTYEFKCKHASHGSTYDQYAKRTLLHLLENLELPDELNILILGETGVGKSTFINAFVNYLTFQSLDEGLSATRLNCIIPCSFSTQYVDHENGGRLMQKSVKIGTDEDEGDGVKGQSATQKTVVYPLYIGHTLVRLIDTPGIGDTRGVEQDRKNMVDVLSVLRNYDKLHGILILLKPNNSRLTVMFRFCIKELLTHLHRSAARNMVFGFTNTRGSNYQPGDTFRPLEALLNEYEDVIPGLFRETVYCYDSESFRYLAARQQGIEMGNIDDYRRSWEHSAGEAHRLLNHFRALQPHQVQATLSLNETRYLIAQLTQPMAEISKSIAKSIAMNEQDAKDLSDKRLSGAALQAKLNLQKTSLSARQLSRPRTVCSNVNCVRVQQDEGKEVVVHKAMCHNPCCLTDVPPNSVGTRQLQGCAAFDRGKCRQCHHQWTEHLHVVVEYLESCMVVPDPTVKQAIQENATEIEVKEAAIRAKHKLIQELQAEHHLIQKAAAQFSVYLKKNSITAYNDATLEYLDHLIKEEKSKVGFGADPTRLQNLERDRIQYSEFVKAMTLSVETAGKGYKPLDEEGVFAIVAKLYGLQHSGKDLKLVAKVVGTAYAATFREKPYRVRGKNYWMMAPPTRVQMNTYGNSGMAITDEKTVVQSGEPSAMGSSSGRKPHRFRFSRNESEKENMEPSESHPPPYSTDPSLAWKEANRRTGLLDDDEDDEADGGLFDGAAGVNGKGPRTSWWKNKLKKAESKFRFR